MSVAPVLFKALLRAWGYQRMSRSGPRTAWSHSGTWSVSLSEARSGFRPESQTSMRAGWA